MLMTSRQQKISFIPSFINKKHVIEVKILLEENKFVLTLIPASQTFRQDQIHHFSLNNVLHLGTQVWKAGYLILFSNVADLLIINKNQLGDNFFSPIHFSLIFSLFHWIQS